MGVRKIISFLSSVKLAVFLIAYLMLTSMLATLVPQGQTPEFYASRFPPLISSLISVSGFSRFFSSLPFLLPVLAFFINLTACTVKRLILEIGKKSGRRFAPVILHFGLMLLVLGSLLSWQMRRDGIVFLSRGEQVELPGNRMLTLLDFTFERYADGRPKEWKSRVTITVDGKIETESFDLRVNHPLKTGSITLYQASYGNETTLRGIVDTSGIQAVEDPGYPLVLAALLITGFGISATFIRKLGEKKE